MAQGRHTLMDPPIEELLDKVDSKFTLVALGSARARQVNSYYDSLGEGLGKVVPPQVASVSGKPVSIAFEEIAAGKATFTRPDPEEEAALAAAIADAAEAGLLGEVEGGDSAEVIEALDVGDEDPTASCAGTAARTRRTLPVADQPGTEDVSVNLEHAPPSPRVVLGVCGGIAAYKAVEVCRRLVDAGVHVTPILTPDATRFVGAVTFSALASEPAQQSLWDESSPIPHTQLGQGADLVVLAPATAHTIARYAAGLADDLLCATLLATRAPVIVCPAMHTEMWEHASVRDNLALLERRGVEIIPPESGRLAGGDSGAGRLADPLVIVQRVLERLGRARRHDLRGTRVVVSAGGTHEPLDPVRFITNRSSGKQGHAVATAAARRGAAVTLVTSSPLSLPADVASSVTRVDVETAADMEHAVGAAAEGADVVVMAAAVADFRPKRAAGTKLAKEDGTPELVLEPTPDILAGLAARRRPHQVLVGFAAETHDALERGRRKLERKGVDLLVVNDVSAPGAGFDHDTNTVVILGRDGSSIEIPLTSKDAVANALLDRVIAHHNEKRSDAVKTTFTSESVTEGHPDKMADQISDAVLDAILEGDPSSRVACETLLTTGLVVVAGEVTTSTYVDIPSLVRDTVCDIGYDNDIYGFNGRTCGVLVSLDAQSPDIAQGVDAAFELRTGKGGEDLLNAEGAGDQGMMFGYACDETPDLMPLPIWLSHRLSERLAQVRRAAAVPYLRPDGKTQVSVVYEDGRPVRIDTVLISTQHAGGVDLEDQLRPDLIEHVINPLLPTDLDHDGLRVFVNPTGIFELGGPHADTGLTGRKIIVDTYGGMARHGGGAFSGKDPSKVDRSAAYAARWVAKHVVAAGAARRCEVQVAYAIGVAHPVSLLVETFGTEVVDPEKISSAVRELFDLRPAAITCELDLRRPIYKKTAAYGHFGRSEKEFTWEATPRVDDLRAALGL